MCALVLSCIIFYIGKPVLFCWPINSLNLNFISNLLLLSVTPCCTTHSPLQSNLSTLDPHFSVIWAVDSLSPITQLYIESLYKELDSGVLGLVSLWKMGPCLDGWGKNAYFCMIWYNLEKLLQLWPEIYRLLPHIVVDHTLAYNLVFVHLKPSREYWIVSLRGGSHSYLQLGICTSQTQQGILDRVIEGWITLLLTTWYLYISNPAGNIGPCHWGVDHTLAYNLVFVHLKPSREYWIVSLRGGSHSYLQLGICTSQTQQGILDRVIEGWITLLLTTWYLYISNPAGNIGPCHWGVDHTLAYNLVFVHLKPSREYWTVSLRGGSHSCLQLGICTSQTQQGILDRVIEGWITLLLTTWYLYISNPAGNIGPCHWGVDHTLAYNLVFVHLKPSREYWTVSLRGGSHSYLQLGICTSQTQQGILDRVIEGWITLLLTTWYLYISNPAGNIGPCHWGVDHTLAYNLVFVHLKPSREYWTVSLRGVYVPDN